jgi:7,8-dihydroneopterin aldolase/epimerase/oxygenase
MNSDHITLTGVSARGFHGVFDFERRQGQDFIVDVVLHVEGLADAARSDVLTGTVHYGEVAQRIVAHITGEPVDLIETLALRIGEDLVLFPRVTSAQVTVHKPSAPITDAEGAPIKFQDVSVTLTVQA